LAPLSGRARALMIANFFIFFGGVIAGVAGVAVFFFWLDAKSIEAEDRDRKRLVAAVEASAKRDQK